VDLVLPPPEIRVLGALIEKETTTPEYYPLTLNALVAACNQKSNRDPVVAYDDETVTAAVHSLSSKGLAARITRSGTRVEKYEQRISERLNLGRRELGVLAVLMLRGPQTPGELHARAARMHEFTDIAEVEATLERMMEWQPEPLVARLPRAPGTREARYAHLLGGPPDLTAAAAAEPPRAAAASRDDEIAGLAARLERLEQQVQALSDEFARFRKQFE
jgi:uncharacterized protein YceH (UPF0502 family)